MNIRTLIVLILLILLAVCGKPLTAQVPPTISVQLYLEESGIAVSGRRSLDVGWYTAATGGIASHSEQITTDVVDGIATIFLGSSVPLPPDLLLGGPFWLGISIDGGAELQPRTMLASVPYAMLADRARIAQALAPEVTGVVTSVNEIAGTIQVVGGSGIAVDRAGTTLTISHQRRDESGTIAGRPGESSFFITPLTTLLPEHTIVVGVVSDTHIAAWVRNVDFLTNTIHVITSAPLLSNEQVLWSIR